MLYLPARCRRTGDSAGGRRGSERLYYAREHVFASAIETAPEDWARLRAQSRTLADILGGEDCLAEPFADTFLVLGHGDGRRDCLR